jgi:hypothetical protein
MLLDKETKDKFGYTIDSLTFGSNNSVALRCDYCQEDYETSYKNRNRSYKKFPKDCCSKCKFKKREEASLHIHGVKNSSQRPEVRKKISDSGWMQSEEFVKKRKDSMIEKYGTDSVFSSKELSLKIKNTMIEKYGTDNVNKIPGILDSNKIKIRETKIKNGTIKTIDNKTLPEHAKEAGLSRSFFAKLVKEKGFEEAIAHEKKISSLEIKISNFLDSINVSYLKDQVIDGKKPDFIVGDVIIECDGLRWHSDLFVPDSYHKTKMETYKNNNYRPLFFRTHELDSKFEIVSSIIKNKIGICDNRIFARKCKIKEIDKKESKEFIKQNHLMGQGNTTVAYGLYYNNSLFSVLEMKRLKNNDWEISRFCNKINYSIIGGFSKLLSCFEKNHKYDIIKTFIDLRYGEGEYLESLGFLQCSSELSFKWTNGSKVYNRMQYPGNSGYENKLNKIWDCGQRKYIKRIKNE